MDHLSSKQMFVANLSEVVKLAKLQSICGDRVQLCARFQWEIDSLPDGGTAKRIRNHEEATRPSKSSKLSVLTTPRATGRIEIRIQRAYEVVFRTRWK